MQRYGDIHTSYTKRQIDSQTQTDRQTDRPDRGKIHIRTFIRHTGSDPVDIYYCVKCEIIILFYSHAAAPHFFFTQEPKITTTWFFQVTVLLRTFSCNPFSAYILDTTKLVCTTA